LLTHSEDEEEREGEEEGEEAGERIEEETQEETHLSIIIRIPLPSLPSITHSHCRGAQQI
jgi:hypothetical protein